MTDCYLIAYDISDPTRRNSALALLRMWSYSYQDSVFEVSATTRECQHLLAQLYERCDDQFDKVICIQYQLVQQLTENNDILRTSGKALFLVC